MIIVNDEAALRLECKDVNFEESKAIINTLEQELYNSAKTGNPGIGLAAPQCGIAKNVAIIRINDIYKVNLVNCSIENKYDSFIFKDEGCLSFPGKLEDTKRFNEIHILNNLVYPYSFIATGLMAVVVQHELDHLNKILLPDLILPKIKRKVGPNDKCPCGSLKKYKKCCFKNINSD
jgi:peptide deformylase